jgi:hypothetical protein
VEDDFSNQISAVHLCVTSGVVSFARRLSETGGIRRDDKTPAARIGDTYWFTLALLPCQSEFSLRYLRFLLTPPIISSAAELLCAATQH